MDNTIQAHQKELCNKLWAMANALRGNMEAYEFKNYILGMIFYYYLSDKTEKYMVNLLKDDGIGYEEAWADPEYKEAVVEEALRDLGFVIEPQFLFRKMVKMVENRSFDIEFLQKAINSLMESTIGNDSQEDFDGLFSDMQLDSTKLGHTVKDRSAVMSKIISSLDEINFGVEDTKIDVLGNAYEYLIGQFAATAGKKAGEFYTPSGPAELLCRIACLGLTDVKDAADPTCGSGSLLLRLKNYANVRNYYGQELTSTTYNLARMNMILRGIPYRNFNIYNGDTLEHDYFGDKKFRVQVANPPYSAHWSADMRFMEDPRFNEYGKLAPKSKADFAFVQHMNLSRKTAGILIALFTGIRIGELCGLQMKDISLTEKTININKTVQRIYDKRKGKSYLHIGPPKTKTSARIIPVPSLLMNIIKKFYTENPNHYFLTGKTKPTEPRTYRQFFSRFLKRNGLQKVKFHEIRHTFAVRAIEIPEFDIKSLSEILGHKNVSFTLNVYGSANLQQKVKCMNLLNDLL